MTQILGRAGARLRTAILAALVATGAAAVIAPAARADLPAGAYAFDAPVESVVRAPSGELFVSGQFTQARTLTGGGMQLTPGSATPVASFPPVRGSVLAVASDGAGGWYIGGDFSHVGGLPRAGLAHVTSTGGVDSWNPGVTPGDEVRAIAYANGVVYAGGDFFTVGGLQRDGIAAVNAITGVVSTTWNPGATTMVSVDALAVADGVVYIGGDFNKVGASGTNLAAVTTGGASVPNFPRVSSLGQVRALAVAVDKLYVGGDFAQVITRIDSDNSDVLAVDRAGLGAIDLAGNTVDGFAADVTGAGVNALSLAGTTLYVGGDFTKIGAETRANIAAVAAADGTVSSFTPSADGPVTAIASNGASVFAGGGFTSIGGKAAPRLAQLDPINGDAVTWAPDPDGPVAALATSGTATLYAGGSFRTAGPATSVAKVAKLSAAGALDTSWQPQFGGTPARGALAVSGTKVYVGGSAGLATLNVADGLPAPDAPQLPGAVSGLAVDGSTLYAVGGFSEAGSPLQARAGAAAFNVGDGTLTGWTPAIDGGSATTVAAGSGVVYLGGTFSTLSGDAHARVGAVDPTTGSATSWNPALVGAQVNTIAPSGSTVYIGGVFTEAGGKVRNNLAAVDVFSGTATPWAPNADGEVRGIAVGAGAVYAAGTFTVAGSAGRRALVALAPSPSVGSATAWNPGIDIAVGMRSGNAVVVNGGTVVLGGSFSRTAERPAGNLAILTDPLFGNGPTPRPPTTTSTTPTTTTTTTTPTTTTTTEPTTTTTTEPTATTTTEPATTTPATTTSEPAATTTTATQTTTASQPATTAAPPPVIPAQFAPVVLPNGQQVFQIQANDPVLGFPMACNNAFGCGGAVKLQQLKSGPSGPFGVRALRATRTFKTIILGKAGFKIPAFRARSIKIRINAIGRARLKKAGKRGIKVRIVVTSTNRGIKPVSRTVTLKLKTPRRPAARPK
ncbi:hypothetical protein DSM112329_05298 [Paraconexibacter sp. AEG42_29]|uniref:Uncharacterized protein n=1 Tax=Paraconexibacter sp. AEG42_29 TaxID=2997339 RepID=A0AAU7B372_9ACTN